MRSKTKLDSLEDFLRKKKEAFIVKVTTTLDATRVTTRIQGGIKNRFFDDCIKRQMTEAEMARKIIEVYYSIIDTQPYLMEKEIPEIKNFIKERIKL